MIKRTIESYTGICLQCANKARQTTIEMVTTELTSVFRKCDSCDTLTFLYETKKEDNQ